jgi:hypothetical protein
MLKSLIAGVTALSLTMAGALPAAANGLDRETAAKLIIGLAAAAVIGSAIENNRDDNRSTQARDNHNNGGNNRNNGGINRNNNWSDLNRNSNRRVLPSDCLTRVETRFGTQRMFGQRCLERNYRHVNSLPARCAVRVYSDNGPRRGYDPLCLRDQGYRTNRRN